MNEENGRFDWLHKEIVELRAAQQASFEQLRNEIRSEIANLRKELTQMIRDHEESINSTLDNHNERIRTLETWRAWVLGAAAVATAVVTWIWQIIRG